MTITAEQLDELERFARSEQKAGWPKCSVDFDVTLRLVAITRAALAWSDASRDAARLRQQWSHTDDDTLLPRIGRLDQTIVEQRLALDIALRGAP